MTKITLLSGVQISYYPVSHQSLASYAPTELECSLLCTFPDTHLWLTVFLNLEWAPSNVFPKNMYLSSLQDLDKMLDSSSIVSNPSKEKHHCLLYIPTKFFWQFVKQLSPFPFLILVNSELVLSHLLLHPPYLYTVSFYSISRWDISI